jgi:hypothetical protein
MVMTLVTSDGTSSTLTLDPGPRTVNRLGVGSSPWDKDAVETWYQQIGLDTTDKQVVADADEITRVVDSLLMNPGNPYILNLTEHANPTVASSGGAAGMPFSNGVFGSMAADLIVLAAGALAYVGGIIFIVVRRSRLRRLAA